MAYEQLAYQDFTGAVTTAVTTEAGAATVVSASFTSDGSPVWVSFFAPYGQTAAAANSELIGVLYMGSTSQGRLFRISQGAATLTACPVFATRRITPTAGSVTFSVRIYESGGTASVTAGVGGSGNFVPGFIRINRA